MRVVLAIAAPEAARRSSRRASRHRPLGARAASRAGRYIGKARAAVKPAMPKKRLKIQTFIENSRLR
jgi:hypothetical protein